MRAADTNILVRLLVRDDPEQAQAAEGFVAPGAWISLLVAAEASWVLRTTYGWPAGAIAAAFQGMLRHNSLVLENPDLVAAALGVFQSHRGLEFADCLILASARAAGHLPLGTFDRKLGRVPGAQQLASS